MIVQIRANRLIKENVDALLIKHGYSRKDLAQWCRKSESWISKIYREERRGFAINQLDRIADFFGLTAHQLLQPGISRATERRKGERRTGAERRIGARGRLASHLRVELDKVPRLTSSRGTDHGPDALSTLVAAVIAKAEQEIAILYEKENARRQTPGTGGKVPDPSKGRRGVRRSHAETA